MEAKKKTVLFFPVRKCHFAPTAEGAATIGSELARAISGMNGPAG